MKKMHTTILLLLIMTTLSNAQDSKPVLTNRVNLLFGMNQLLVGGFNIEGNIFYKRIAFDYSHGMSLEFSNKLLTGEAAEQGLAVHIPWTTGFGIGYRFREWINIRIEPKWHKFELYYESDEQNTENQITDYTTFTLGIGAYVNWQPFKRQQNGLKGLMVSPSFRYWPNIATSLEDDQFDYLNKNSGEIETHEALNIGIANTPFIFNISIGYTYQF